MADLVGVGIDCAGSQIYEGASSSLWFAVVQVSGTVMVFALSIRCGSGRFLSRNDYRILGFAAAGLALWYFTETAVYALAITITISVAGGVATALQAYRDPASETLSTWMVSLVAACCAILSVGEPDPILLAYPLYLFTLYLVFVSAILMGRARLRVAVGMRPVARIGSTQGSMISPYRTQLRRWIHGLQKLWL